LTLLLGDGAGVSEDALVKAAWAVLLSMVGVAACVSLSVTNPAVDPVKEADMVT